MKKTANRRTQSASANGQTEIKTTSRPNSKPGPKGPRQSTLALRAKLVEILESQVPFTIRQAFYQATTHHLVDKSESGYGVIQRNLLAMRRENMIPYSWVTDLHREIRGFDSWESWEEFVNDSQVLYRKDLWATIRSGWKSGLRKQRSAGSRSDHLRQVGTGLLRWWRVHVGDDNLQVRDRDRGPQETNVHLHLVGLRSVW